MAKKDAARKLRDGMNGYKEIQLEKSASAQSYSNITNSNTTNKFSELDPIKAAFGIVKDAAASDFKWNYNAHDDNPWMGNKPSTGRAACFSPRGYDITEAASFKMILGGGYSSVELFPTLHSHKAMDPFYDSKTVRVVKYIKKVSSEAINKTNRIVHK